MKNQKLKIGIICAAIAVVFYLLGSFIGWPIKNDKLSGDIGKAKKASSTVVKIDRDALQEKMLSDTAFCHKTLATVGMMQLHAKQFGALLVLTDAVAKDEKTLQSSLEEMQKVQETVKNATAAIDIFADDMVRLSKGEKVNGFEQDYNNAMLGFSMLQRCSDVAVGFAQNVRDSLNLLAEANKKDIETICTEWVTFAYADALMSQDKLRCTNIEQLFLSNSGDQLGENFVDIRYNSGDQLGLNLDKAVLGNQMSQGEQLGAKFLESLVLKYANTLQCEIANLANTEQLKTMLADAQRLNVTVATVLNSDKNLGVKMGSGNENSLGSTIRAEVRGNSVDLPCVEMLGSYLQTNQGNLQLIITDMDVLGGNTR